jgi:RNA-binding protein
MGRDEAGSSEMRSSLQIGKNGITESVLDEIDEQLKNTGIVKINMLRSAPEAKTFKAAVTEAADKLQAALIGVRGRTAVFKRHKGKSVRPEKK